MRCAVITPIGPGHEALYATCAGSVRHAFATDPGPFEDVLLIGMEDPQGRIGRSRRRNEGVAEAARRGVEWLFFLDADDLMHARAFAHAAPWLGSRDAVWGAIAEMPFDGGGPARLRLPQLGPTEDLAAILASDPFRSLQMGHFVRTEVALRHPFDTRLDVGEDFAYYLEVWRAERCVKIAQALFVNRRGRHATGPRAGDGRRWRQAVRTVFSAFCARHGLPSAAAW